MPDWKRLTTGVALFALAAGGVAAGHYIERTVLEVQQRGAAPPYDLDEQAQGDAGEGDGLIPAIPAFPQRPQERPEQLANVVNAPGGNDLYWGLYHPGIPYEEGVLDDRADLANATPAIVMWFQEWAGSQPFPAGEASDLVDRGIVPMITWEAWDPPAQDPSLEPQTVREEANQRRFELDRIVEGEFDDYIRSYAQDVAKYGGPLMLRPFHEFDGFWFPWGGTVNNNEPEDVVEAWRHVHDIFEEVGATNVTWVWNPNHRSVPDTPQNQIDNYWPGEQYVDWIGISGFNFGTTSEVASWLTFTEVYEERMEDLEAYDKPIVIAEFAAPDEGGDKAEWIREAFEVMQEQYPNVGGAVWFDREVGDIRDFRINSTQDALRAFREVINDQDVLSAPTALVTTEPGRSPEPEEPAGPEQPPEPEQTLAPNEDEDP